MEPSEQLRSACSILFGPHVENAESLLDVLDLSAIKAIYRHRVKGEGLPHGVSLEMLDLAYERIKQFKIDHRQSPAGSAAPADDATEPLSDDRSPLADGFWTGSLPERRLLFGHFLYYSGRISRMTLEKAITWQRKQRPLFGQLAIEMGYSIAESIAEVVTNVQMNELIGEACVRLGIMTEYQRDAVLGRQRTYPCRLDNYLVEQGILGHLEAQEFFSKQRLHNIRLGRKPTQQRR